MIVWASLSLRYSHNLSRHQYLLANDAHTHTHTHTQTHPKSLNPQWKERFSLRMYDGDSTILHMEVWDHDFPQSDDFIGR